MFSFGVRRSLSPDLLLQLRELPAGRLEVAIQPVDRLLSCLRFLASGSLGLDLVDDGIGRRGKAVEYPGREL